MQRHYKTHEENITEDKGIIKEMQEIKSNPFSRNLSNIRTTLNLKKVQIIISKIEDPSFENLGKSTVLGS